MSIKDSIVNLIIKGRDQLSPITETASKSVKVLDKKADALKKTLRGLEDNQKLISSFESIEEKTVESKKAFEKAEAELVRLEKAYSKVGVPTKKMSVELGKSAAAANKAKQVYQKNTAELVRLKGNLEKAGVSTKNLAGAQELTAFQMKSVRGELEKVNNKLKTQRKSARTAATGMKELNTESKGLVGSLKGAALGVTGFIGAALGLNKVKQLFLDILGTGDKFEILEKRITQAMGGIEAGESATEWIKQFTRDVPLQLDGVTQAFLKMKAFGLDPMDGTMQALVDTSSALGGTQEDLAGVVNAVGQAWSKQKLQQEEALQLIERGVPVWDLMSKATGRTAAELQKMATKGELGRDSIKTLIAAMGEANTGAAASQMQTLSGYVSNLKDRWQDFLNQIAESGVLDYANQQLKLLLETVSEMAKDGRLKEWAKSISDSLISMGKGFKWAATKAVEFKDAIGLVVAALGVSAVVKFTGALKAAGIGIVSLVGKFGSLGKGASKATSTITTMGSRLAAIAKPWPITIAVIGFALADKLLDKITGRTKRLMEVQQAFAELEERQRRSTLNAAQALNEKAYALKEYRNTATKTRTEIERMNKDERKSYAASLDSAREYHETMLESLVLQADLGRDVSEEMVNLKGRLSEINETLQVTEAASTRAGESLKLGIKKEALDSIVAFRKLKNAGKDAGDSLTEVAGSLDLSDTGDIEAYIQAIENLSKTSEISGDDIRQSLLKPLEELTTQQLVEFQLAWKTAFEKNDDSTQQSAAVIESTLADALRRLGVDSELAATGMSTVGKEAVKSFDVAVDAVKAMGKTSAEEAELIHLAFKSALNKVGTESGLDELKVSLKQAFDSDQMGHREYKASLKEIEEKYKKLGKKGVESQDKVSASVGETKEKLDEVGDSAKEAADAAAKARQEFRQAFGDAFGKALSSARESVTALSSAARELFEQRLLGDDYTSGMSTTIEKLNAARQKTDELVHSSQNLMKGSLANWFTDIALKAARVKQEFYEQKLSMEGLISRINSGNLSLSELNRLSESAGDRFKLLDDSDLSTLTSAINSARSAMESLNSSAASTLANLRNELDQMAGNSEAIEKRRYEQQRAKLQRELENAQQQGAKTAASDYQESLKLLDDVHKKKLSDIKTEREAAKKAEEERKAEALAQKEREAKEKQAQNTTTNKQTNSNAQQPAGTRIVLQAAGGQEVDVQTSDPEGLLTVLEQYGMRSAS